MTKDLFSDLVPDEAFEPTPEFICQMLSHTYQSLLRYRICREHPARTDAEYELSQAMFDMNVNRIHEAEQEVRRMANPKDKRIAELETRIRSLELDLEKARAAERKATAKVSGLTEDRDLHQTRATNLEQLATELRDKNLSRVEVERIAQLAVALFAGLRYVQFLQDANDVNRQLVCGMFFTCQQILQECGAEPEVQVSWETAGRVLMDYYSRLPQRDIDDLKRLGHFHGQLPQRAA